MRTLFNILCVLSLTFTTFAKNEAIKKKNLLSITEKYEFLLSSHPSAHLDSFRELNIKKLNKELKNYFENKSLSTVRKEALDIVAKVPRDDKKSELSQIILNGNKEEIKKLLTNKKLIKDAFQGEGSNFSTGEDLFINVVITLAVVGIIYAILDSVSERINYEIFSSYKVEGDYWDGFCSSSNISASEEEDMKADALFKCQDRATYPETCRFHEWDSETYVDYYYDYHGEYSVSGCTYKVKYKADRK